MSNFCQDALLISLQVDLDTIGLKSLHATLMREGFSSAILYLPGLRPDDKALLEEVGVLLRDNPPGFIGISLMSHEHYGAVALTEYIRKAAPGIPIVWGGIHPTIAPEICLDHADYICVGEGETAVVNFAAAIHAGKHVGQIPNFWCKKDGKIVKTPLAPLIKDLDRLPFSGHVPGNSFIAHQNRIMPLGKTLFRKYARWKGTVYSFMGSRGCPFSCAYCCNDFLTRLYGTKAIRRRSVNNIMAELAAAMETYPDIVYVNFQDDCFLACSDDYLAEFCDAYQNRIRRPFIVRCIPSFINQGRLRRLKEAGLSWISMGLQSGSDRVLNDIYNRQSFSGDFLKAAAVIRKAEVAAYYDVILDNPLESNADRLDTIAVLAAIPRPYFLQLFSLVLFPGTGLYRRIVDEKNDPPREYLVKNYHDYRKTDLNRLTRISAYIPRLMTRRLAALYGRRGSSLKFRFYLFFNELVSALVLEPTTYFRLLRISCQGNTARAVRMLPAYFRVGLSRYVKQFQGRVVKRVERMIRDHSSGEW